ncbi:MAG: hypothetical protein JO161_10385, partial [Planctomycetaceae bacterium]|nr:hypothetical protein [Planctomycetaceae bacterium]
MARTLDHIYAHFSGRNFVNTKSIGMVFCLVAVLVVPARAQEPASVTEILDRNDRALVRELSAYLSKSPHAEDRDQGYAALFNKAIEHDWFAETEQTAQRYLAIDPDGPVRALAQIITTMARARAGHFNEALAHYKELLGGLGKSDQEEFASSFTDAFATAAITAGEFTTARAVF